MNQAIKIKGNKVITYYPVNRGNWSQERSSDEMRKLAQSNYKGSIGYAARNRIEKRFEYWHELLKASNRIKNHYDVGGERKFVLITLTLPAKQKHDDKYLKKHALKPFIQELIRNHNLVNWMWKAEAQKNGNIHFHIVIDQYIELQKLLSTWKYYMQKLGYLYDFLSNHPFSNFNAVDVKGQSEMRNPVAYLTKYMEKEQDRRIIEGAVWRMSNSLVRAQEFTYYCERFDNFLLENAVNQGGAIKIEHDYATVYVFKRKPRKRMISREYEEMCNLYYEQEARELFEAKDSDFQIEDHLTEEEIKEITRAEAPKKQKKKSYQTTIKDFFYKRDYLD